MTVYYCKLKEGSTTEVERYTTSANRSENMTFVVSEEPEFGYDGGLYLCGCCPDKPLEYCQKCRISTLKSIKNETIALCKVPGDKCFQTDDESLVTIESRISYLNSIDDTEYEAKTYLQSWRCSDNSMLSFVDRTNALEILNAVNDLARENWGVYNDLSAQILACETTTEIEAIDINSGWVAMDITT